MKYITGTVIRELRMKKQMTQKELARLIQVSDKTISKWETDKGIPDIGILEELAVALGISIPELLTGNIADNKNKSANMRKTVFYVCPICGNIITAAGEGHYSCCGITLPKLEGEEEEKEHTIFCEEMDGEFCISMEHEMSKIHYISFFAYVTLNQIQLVKVYPEQNAECRMTKRGHGFLYAFCNRHGLFCKKI